MMVPGLVAETENVVVVVNVAAELALEKTVKEAVTRLKTMERVAEK